jgi:hypothetical protein
VAAQGLRVRRTSRQQAISPAFNSLRKGYRCAKTQIFRQSIYAGVRAEGGAGGGGGEDHIRLFQEYVHSRLGKTVQVMRLNRNVTREQLLGTFDLTFCPLSRGMQQELLLWHRSRAATGSPCSTLP